VRCITSPAAATLSRRSSLDDADRTAFLEVLTDIVERFGVSRRQLRNA
jgi:hypothetical protein